jgi:hypothetical protein
MRNPLLWLLLLASWPVVAAERQLDFSDVPEGQTPPGFRSLVMGNGQPGNWKVVLDQVQTPLSLAPEAAALMRHGVLAQLAQDPGDEHFPMLVYEEDSFGDFTLVTRFKTVAGKAEQMAGIAFRLQNETNYYVVRASSLGKNFRFYKVLNGMRGPLVGPEFPIPTGVWHDLKVECKGSDIHCSLDGKELISVTDKVNPFTSGKIGFWTKSDSVSYFSDTKVTYIPREATMQKLVQEMTRKNSHLLGLQVFVAGTEPGTTRMIASKDQGEIGRSGAVAEREVLKQGNIYYGKDKNSFSVLMPIRDRNGDPIATVRVVMKTFLGQTEQNAVVRATPIVKELQARIQSLDDLID